MEENQDSQMSIPLVAGLDGIDLMAKQHGTLLSDLQLMRRS
jgi:hypothetical protein